MLIVLPGTSFFSVLPLCRSRMKGRYFLARMDSTYSSVQWRRRRLNISLYTIFCTHNCSYTQQQFIWWSNWHEIKYTNLYYCTTNVSILRLHEMLMGYWYYAVHVINVSFFKNTSWTVHDTIGFEMILSEQMDVSVFMFHSSGGWKQNLNLEDVRFVEK